MTDADFESRVLRFEQDARGLGPRRIEDYLGPPFTPGAPGRGRLLVELICIDLEFRWRDADASGRPTWDAYLERFPELAGLDGAALELIAEEYRARRRWGDRPSPEAFAARFGERSGAVRAALVRVDAELEVESTGPVRPSPQPDEPVDFRPTLSHRDLRLLRLIGAGRMGKVYEARRLAGDGRVAVKFLRKSLLRRPEVVRRFLGEARTVAGLAHPNIVGMKGLGRTEGGSWFFVMDLVAGLDLARRAGGRGVTEAEAIRWGIDVCDALGHAHGRGIVHCDLKPANVLVDPSGRALVTDFGLARSLAGETPGAARVEGTAGFMAPEQACASWGRIDPRTDVYGLGAVLFALLAGRPPFVGASVAEVLDQVVAPTPVAPLDRFRPGLSAPLAEICLLCLAKPPAARYASARDVREALAAL
ncbi:serine/threonine-protein kinase [Paludisphaera soli]|uniref:serine/threonine-protein kinase n=1 Tax=Paludisphaera soli TaxID=2712865 RepID=UPI0013EAAFA1|nr:serine/threonine-protein kinase [Paludisphaera soli]